MSVRLPIIWFLSVHPRNAHFNPDYFRQISGAEKKEIRHLDSTIPESHVLSFIFKRISLPLCFGIGLAAWCENGAETKLKVAPSPFI